MRLWRNRPVNRRAGQAPPLVSIYNRTGAAPDEGPALGAGKQPAGNPDSVWGVAWSCSALHGGLGRRGGGLGCSLCRLLLRCGGVLCQSWGAARRAEAPAELSWGHYHLSESISSTGSNLYTDRNNCQLPCFDSGGFYPATKLSPKVLTSAADIGSNPIQYH